MILKTKNSKLTSISQTLRKQMTKEEKRLWYDFLKKLPLTINRQKVFCNYVLDFYCAEKKIVIELDGAQHYEEQGIIKDTERDEFLSKAGIKVLRYSNRELNENFEGICLDISRNLFDK